MIAGLLRRDRNFRLDFSASVASDLGDGVAVVAFPWVTGQGEKKAGHEARPVQQGGCRIMTPMRRGELQGNITRSTKI